MRFTWVIIAFAALIVDGEKPKPHSNTDKHAPANTAQQTDSATGRTVAVENEQAPDRRADNHSKEPPSYLHELLLPQNVPAVALVLVGVAGIITAIYTLKVLSRQAVSMRRQTTHLRKSVIHSRKSAEAALLNAQAVVNSERPWMIIELTPIPGAPKQGYVSFHAWNRGRTPAEIMAYQGDFFYHGYSEEFASEPIFKPLETRYRVCISPGNSIEIYGFSLTGSLPPDHWEWMQKERKYLYFYGNIVYRDLIAYSEHESRFCYWLSPVDGVGLIMGGERNWNKYT
jgi:hypothetical protein